MLIELDDIFFSSLSVGACSFWIGLLSDAFRPRKEVHPGAFTCFFSCSTYCCHHHLLHIACSKNVSHFVCLKRICYSPRDIETECFFFVFRLAVCFSRGQLVLGCSSQLGHSSMWPQCMFSLRSAVAGQNRPRLSSSWNSSSRRRLEVTHTSTVTWGSWRP